MVAGRGTPPAGGGEEAHARGGRTPDACPYHRPFPDGFADCPAYRAEVYRPTTTGYADLEPVLTCIHLEAAAVPRRPARFYGRCRLGDAQARRRWAAEHPVMAADAGSPDEPDSPEGQ
jgi:hypothetical protein